MAVGHIALDGEEYRIVWPNYQKGPDNPFAAKLGQGAGKYDDLEGYSATVQDDWRAGIGKVEADAGGTYASTLDTRFRNRMILPAKTELIPITDYASAINENTPVYLATIGGFEHAETISPYFAFELKSLFSSTKLSCFLRVLFTGKNAENMRWQIRPKSGAHPATSASARNSWVNIFATDNPPEGEHWLNLFEDGATGITAGDVVVIENLGPPFFIPMVEASGESVWISSDGDGFWSKTADFAPIFDCYTDNTFALPFWFNGEAHFFTDLGNAATLAGSAGSYYLDNEITGLDLPYDVATFQDELWMALGSSGIKTLSTGYSVTATETDWDATILLRWNNYLYRAYGREIYYTADGSTWTGPFEVGGEGEIRGMAGEGNGNNILVSTDDGLFVFGEGDTTHGVTPWPTVSADNGRDMHHHQGSVYIILADNRLVRYNQGSLLDIWLKDDDDKPIIAQGDLRSLASLGGILYLAIEQPEFGAVLGWNSEGWHYIASLPQNATYPKLIADRETGSLWVGTTKENGTANGHHPLRIPISAQGVPLTNDDYYFASGGWVETDWIHGGLVDLQKDWHSVYIDTDDWGDPYHDIDIYFQDDEESGWKVLIRDTPLGDDSEVIWPTSNRPTSKKIKLAFLLKTQRGGTPVIRGVRIKYQINVNDRWRWQLALDIADEQEMLDGTVNTRTHDEMIAHVEEVIRQVAPVQYRDIDGTSYQIRVKTANQSIEKYEIVEGEPVYTSVYYLSIAET